MKRKFLSASCLSALLGLPALAAAQSVPAPALALPDAQVTTLPPTGPRVYLNTERPKTIAPGSRYAGPLAPLGRTLAEYGIHLNVTYSDTFVDSGDQGLDHHVWANMGKLRFDGTFSLDRFGLSGGEIVAAETIHMFKRAPYQYLSEAGSGPAGAVIGNHHPAYSLSVLAYQQELDDRKLEFEIGRFNPSYDFDPNVCGDGPTCTLNIAKFTGVFLPIDYGQLGAVVRLHLPEDYFVKLGVFESNGPPGDKTGINFLLADSTGVLSVAGIGHQTTFHNAYYPGSWLLMGFQNSSKYTNLQTKATRYGTEAVQLSGLQTVWRSNAGPTPSLPDHHLDAFIKIAATPDSYQPYSVEFNSGLNYYGLLPNRPNDRLGFMLSYYRVGAAALAGQEAVRVKAGGLHEQTNPNEFRFEMLATIDLYRNIKLTPAAIYILNPDDQSGKLARLPTNGFEYTLTLHVPLGALLGLAPVNADGPSA